MVLNFEIYMLPLTLLMIFLKNYVVVKLRSANYNQFEDDVRFCILITLN